MGADLVQDIFEGQGLGIFREAGGRTEGRGGSEEGFRSKSR